MNKSIIKKIRAFIKNYYMQLGMIALALVVCGIGIYFAVSAVQDKKMYENADEQQEIADDMLAEVINRDGPYEYIEFEDKNTEVQVDTEKAASGAGRKVIIDFDSAQKEQTKSKAILASEAKKNAEAVEQTEDVAEQATDNNMYDRIDFSKMKNVSGENVYGWLYVPGTNIDYVVMMGEQNDPYKYLWKDPNGNDSNTGSLFVRYTAPNEDRDDHVIVYGHRLKDHNLYFGGLLNYHDLGYAKSHNTAYLYTKNKAYKYTLCSVHDGVENDPIYYYPYQKGTPEYEWMLSECRNSETHHIKDFNTSKDMLVLSTCSGSRSGQPQRLYLIFEKSEETAY